MFKLPDFLSSDSAFRHSGEQRESRRTYQDALTSQTRVGPFPEALWACSEVPHPHVWAHGAAFGGWQQGRNQLLDLLFFTNSVKSRFFACCHLSIDAPCPNYPRNMFHSSLKCSWEWAHRQKSDSQLSVAQPRTQCTGLTFFAFWTLKFSCKDYYYHR